MYLSSFRICDSLKDARACAVLWLDAADAAVHFRTHGDGKVSVSRLQAKPLHPDQSEFNLKSCEALRHPPTTF